MYHRKTLWTIWLLLLGGALPAGLRADWFDRLHADIRIHNATPFALKVIGSGLLFNPVEAAGRFRFHDDFAAQDYTLAAGTDTAVGYALSHGSELNGYLSFSIDSSDKSFEIYYRFLRDQCTGTPGMMVDMAKGDTFHLLDIQQQNTCSKSERLGLLMPVEAWDYTNSISIRLAADDEAVACIEDSACTPDNYRAAQIAREKTAAAEAQKRDYAKRPPPAHTLLPGTAAGSLELNISLINETPCPLTLVEQAYVFEGQEPARKDPSVRPGEAFRSATLMPGASVPHAISILREQSPTGYAVEAYLTFRLEKADESFIALCRFTTDPLCRPEITLLDAQHWHSWPWILVGTRNSCQIRSGTLGPYLRPGTQSHQDTTLIFTMEEHAASSINLNACRDSRP